MPTERVNTQTLFLESLDEIEESRVWRDSSEHAPFGSYYTQEDIANVLDELGVESILFESIRVKREWGFIFPGESTTTMTLYRVTRETVGDFQKWESLDQ